MGCRSYAPTLGRLLIAVSLFAVACSRGPEVDALRQDLQSRLDADFAEGLFKIRSFDRAGSAPFHDLEHDVSGLFVYYDAELEFLHEYNLTSWKGLNLGTLAFAVGATKSGIQGFGPRINQRGDVLKVHGRLSYHDADGTWRTIEGVEPPEARTGARPTTLEGSGPAAVLRSVRDLLARNADFPLGTRDAAIVEELRISSSKIDLRFARMEGRLAFGSGRAPGTYHKFGSAFSRYATEHGLPMYNYASEGSVENGKGVENEVLSYGLVQSDVAETLFKGWSEVGHPPNPDLRSMASLWPEAVHIITLAGTGIEVLADLRGKRVAIGHPDSGSRFNALLIGAAVGFTRGQFPELHGIGTAESIAHLVAGKVDAIFVTEAFPAPAVQDLSRRRQDVRFVSIDDETLDELSETHFAYYPLTVPAKTYPAQAEPFRTLGLAAVLITNTRAPDEEVERVLEMILESADALSKEYYRAGFISAETMRLGIAVPLHPAAERFYRRESEAGTGSGPRVP